MIVRAVPGKRLCSSVFLNYALQLECFTSCVVEHPVRSDSFYECLIRTFTYTIYHPVGTAKIGREDDVMAVVDPRLRFVGQIATRQNMFVC